MPGGEPTGDEQSEPVALGEVEGTVLGEVAVDLCQPLAGDAKARSSTSMANPRPTS